MHESYQDSPGPTGLFRTHPPADIEEDSAPIEYSRLPDPALRRLSHIRLVYTEGPFKLRYIDTGPGQYHSVRRTVNVRYQIGEQRWTHCMCTYTSSQHPLSASTFDTGHGAYGRYLVGHQPTRHPARTAHSQVRSPRGSAVLVLDQHNAMITVQGKPRENAAHISAARARKQKCLISTA